MSVPAISILLPAYNAGLYIKQAIDSLLTQTFKDFELLVINDGSTDETESVIKTFEDLRIVYVKNEVNIGLIATLNKGIDLAAGKYIARMDADDICEKDRLEKQFAWLEERKTTAVVASYISFINEAGAISGEWKEDIATVTASEIKQKMVRENCIAHPSAMLRADILKKYKYNCNQKNAEDYDLWLRLSADNYIIEKIPEKLLLYRVHATSVTGSILRKTNPFFKQFNCKKNFLTTRIKSGKWEEFESKVLASALLDGIMGIGKNIKTAIKN
jgi:glycosyltransferase involved in cell wall biosynthesis